MRSVKIGPFQVGGDEPLLIIAGPCAIESESDSLRAAETLKGLCDEVGLPYIFKSSFDKANRTSLTSFRGPGLEEGLRILEKVRTEVGVPVNTDIHLPSQAAAVGQVCDLIQIPAFLARQTDLLVAAAQTGKPLMVKKGQFMAPWDMEAVVGKIRDSGCDQIMLCDRGTSFGYNNLISDMRGIPIMQKLGCPVCFDATHSVQLPGGKGTESGGQREFVATLAKASVAAGAEAVFMESHHCPAEAKCDASSQLSFEQLRDLLPQLKALHEATRCLSVR